jgi:hypothetical protein
LCNMANCSFNKDNLFCKCKNDSRECDITKYCSMNREKRECKCIINPEADYCKCLNIPSLCNSKL